MDGFGGSDVLKLAELLRQGQREDDFDDKQKVQPTKKEAPVEVSKPKIIKKKVEHDVDEKVEELLSKSERNWRKTPQWSLIYKQAITPSDVYLQMSGKTQLTSSCEDMVITVDLPGETAASIDVKLKHNHLNLLSPKFRLSIPLPYSVDPQKGNAKWDAPKESLIITLRMDREFDYINF